MCEFLKFFIQSGVSVEGAPFFRKFAKMGPVRSRRVLSFAGAALCATPANERACIHRRRHGPTDGQYTPARSAKTSKTRAARGVHHLALRRRRTLRAAASFALCDSRPAGSGAVRAGALRTHHARPAGALMDARGGRCAPLHARPVGAKAATVHCWHEVPKVSKLISPNQIPSAHKRRDRRTDGQYTRARRDKSW